VAEDDWAVSMADETERLAWGTYTITPAGFHWLEGGLPESSPTDRLRELANEPSEEAAFEATLRAELEEESRRTEGVERELDEVHRESEPERAQESRPATGGAREDAERPWWRRVFGG
jgi:hypothetical protein